MYEHFHMRSEITCNILMHVFNVMILNVVAWDYSVILLTMYGKALNRFGTAYPACFFSIIWRDQQNKVGQNTHSTRELNPMLKGVSYRIKGYVVCNVKLNLVDYHLRSNLHIVLVQQFKKSIKNRKLPSSRNF